MKREQMKASCFIMTMLKWAWFFFRGSNFVRDTQAIRTKLVKSRKETSEVTVYQIFFSYLNFFSFEKILVCLFFSA